MPMVENDEITGTMRGDGENDPVSEFIGNTLAHKGLRLFIFFFSLLQSKLYNSYVGQTCESYKQWLNMYLSLKFYKISKDFLKVFQHCDLYSIFWIK